VSNGTVRRSTQTFGSRRGSWAGTRRHPAGSRARRRRTSTTRRSACCPLASRDRSQGGKRRRNRPSAICLRGADRPPCRLHPRSFFSLLTFAAHLHQSPLSLEAVATSNARAGQASGGEVLSCPAMQADRQLVPHGVAMSGDLPASRRVELAGFPWHGPLCIVSLPSS
jgi:hypothetical protein